MTISSSNNASLDAITNSYKSDADDKAKKSDALGQDAFLTMLVAQLQNQDPLNPMEGSDFSAQLAQFSQLEQLMSLNDSMDSLAKSFGDKSENDVVDYIGKRVTGNVDSMAVEEGSVSGGFYTLSTPADIVITITDSEGNVVKKLYEGQQNTGAHVISWDGTDSSNKAVEDGSYKYTVMGNTGNGFAKVPTSVAGTVDGVAYSNGKAYLVVQGILMDPDSLTSVQDVKEDDTTAPESLLDYLGKTVTTNAPIILVEDGAVTGTELTFDLKTQEAATIKIYDAFDKLVATIELPKDSAVAGENKIEWNGVGESGYHVPDGRYYYTVKSGSEFAKTQITEEVSGIKYVNGTQYLVLNESGRLVSLSTITGIK